MTQFSFESGDMFLTRADAVVNTVNCVGVMGKGVALEFKRRWPENYKFYKRACDRHELVPGKVLIFDRGGMFASDQPRYLINFPTKNHWREKSKLEYIDKGLDSLIDEIRTRGISSVAIPPLGCGNGGLDWGVVRPLILGKLSVLDDVRVEIYGPYSQPSEPEYVQVSAKMTYARAIFLKAVAALEPQFGGSIDRLSLQKIAYLLQNLGVPFNLEFRNSLYGPYSVTLKRALVRLTVMRYLDGYVNGDRSANVTSVGYAAADEYLRLHEAGESVIDRLAHLIHGYDSAYGLELLSSIHFNESRGLAGDEPSQVGAGYRSNVFPRNEVQAAKGRLIEDGLLD